MTMYAMSDLQYQAVYNVLSFALASMMATTVFLWFRSFAVKDQYKSAVLISGLVTFIAAYHYIRIFNSWVEAYHYSVDKVDPALTGVPFNGAYRLRLYVRELTGNPFGIDATTSDTISTVKAQIQDVAGIPADEQKLAFEGQQLEDGAKLSDYYIRDKSMLFCIRKL